MGWISRRCLWQRDAAPAGTGLNLIIVVPAYRLMAVEDYRERQLLSFARNETEGTKVDTATRMLRGPATNRIFIDWHTGGALPSARPPEDRRSQGLVRVASPPRGTA